MLVRLASEAERAGAARTVAARAGAGAFSVGRGARAARSAIAFHSRASRSELRRVGVSVRVHRPSPMPARVCQQPTTGVKRATLGNCQVSTAMAGATWRSRPMLMVAKKRGLLDVVPEIERLKAPKPDFDFFDFDEATRLVNAADGEWRCMILVALRTGLRQGELLALRWEDVDLQKGLLRVRQSVTRGHVTEPKSGRSRDIPLSDDAVAALKAQRHLRGPLVFCADDGRMLRKEECKHPLWRACKRSGLRRIGWHVLRHTFASHLTMRGVPLKVVQELLGHATMEMTMRYAHLSLNVPREAVRLLDAGRGTQVAPDVNSAGVSS
jgi:integrase